MLSHRIKAALGAITTVGLLGLFAVPGEVHAAITVTVTDSSGAAVGGAFVAVLNSDGDAVDSAITAKDGTVSVNEAGGAGLVVATTVLGVTAPLWVWIAIGGLVLFLLIKGIIALISWIPKSSGRGCRKVKTFRVR
jgi:hypothetical protein